MAWPSSRGVSASGGSALAFGDEQLQLDQVEPGHELGDGMLDLEAGVHLQERKAAVGREQELDRAGALVPDGPGGLDRGMAHPSPQVGVDRR